VEINFKNDRSMKIFKNVGFKVKKELAAEAQYSMSM
jgi:hypothetical protein